MHIHDIWSDLQECDFRDSVPLLAYIYISNSSVLVSQFLKVTQVYVRLHTVILGYENMIII